MKAFARWLAALLAVATSFAVDASHARGQAAEQKAPLRILAVGNFLGQLDGFCENPGGTYDLSKGGKPFLPPPCVPGGPGGQGQATPPAPAGEPSAWPAALGGLLGAREWIARERSDGTLLLFAGNNQVADFGEIAGADVTGLQTTPQQQLRKRRHGVADKRASDFWNEMQSLAPTVVALGPEDFLRSLRTPAADRQFDDPEGRRAREFVAWVRDGGRGKVKDLPLLASNAFVKVERPNLNVVQVGGYELQIDADESVGWVGSLTLEHPCGVALSVRLEETAPGARARAAPVTPTTKSCDSSGRTVITVDSGSLRPAHFYTLHVTSGGAVREFRFQTHEALMPRALAVSPLAAGRDTAARDDPLGGYPVVRAPTGAGEDLLILSLIAPDTTQGLGESAWTFKESAGSKTSRTIGFMPPAAAVSAMLRRLAAVKAPGPFVVLLSTLTDADTLDLVDEFPEIRMVVLAPDSSILGRASRATEDGPPRSIPFVFSRRLKSDAVSYSGDRGLGSIVDRDRSPATRLLARPEWIGETGGRLEATLSRNAYGEWLVEAPSVHLETIAGVPLDYRAAGEEVTYWPLGHPSLSSGSFRQYRNVPVDEPTGDDAHFIAMWKDKATLGAVAAEAIRTTLGADIAIVPEDLVDEDALGWLEHALKTGRTDWISRFILERALFRSYRFVRADIAGSELVDKLTKALADPLGTGTKSCVVGLQQEGCPLTLDEAHPERLRVRGRAIVPTVFYNVALPDGVAEKLGLNHDDDVEDSVDALDTVHEYLVNRRWEARRESTALALPIRFEQRARNEVRSYVKVATAELGYSLIDVSEPDERKGVLANLPVDFSGSKPERSKTAKLDVDLAVFEARRTALRVLGTVDFSRRQVDRGPLPPDVTYPRDQYVAGVRLEKRYITRIGALEWRPYMGAFSEGPFRRETNELKASTPASGDRQGFTATQVATFTTPLSFEPSRFQHAALGLDVLPAANDLIAWKWLDGQLNRFGVAWGYGRQTNVLVALGLGGEPQSIDALLAQGAGKLLDAYALSHPATFSAETEWTPDFQSQRQFRTKVEVDGELAIKTKDRKYRIALSLAYGGYRMNDAADLALSRTWKVSTKFTVPLLWRLELVPAWEYQRATIYANDNNAFSVHRFDARLRVPIFIRFSRKGFVQ